MSHVNVGEAVLQEQRKKERIEGMGTRKEGGGDSCERTRAGAWRRKIQEQNQIN